MFASRHRRNQLLVLRVDHLSDHQTGHRHPAGAVFFARDPLERFSSTAQNVLQPGGEVLGKFSVIRFGVRIRFLLLLQFGFLALQELLLLRLFCHSLCTDDLPTLKLGIIGHVSQILRHLR